MGPMPYEVDRGYQTKSMVSKRGAKGAVDVAIVVSDVPLEMALRTSENTAEKSFYMGITRGSEGF